MMDAEKPPCGDSEALHVTVKREGAGVYRVTVRVDDQQPGSSLVRTSPERYTRQEQVKE